MHIHNVQTLIPMIQTFFYFLHICNIPDILTMFKDRPDMHSLPPPPPPNNRRFPTFISTFFQGTNVNIKGLVRVFPCDK